MFIHSQDKDIIFPLTDKGLLKGTVYTKDIYIGDKYYGIRTNSATMLIRLKPYKTV